MYLLNAVFSKWPPSKIDCPYLHTIESFCKLVSKVAQTERFCAKNALMFRSTYTCVRVAWPTFSIYEAS